MHGIDADGPPRLRRELLARLALALHGQAEPLLGPPTVVLRLAERQLRVGERRGGRRTGVRRREHVAVERVQPLARRLPGLEPLVPPRLTPLLLPAERAQPCGRQLAGELLGLRREGLVLLGHLRLLLQGLQLAAELREHVGQPEQILVQSGQLALRPFLPSAMLGDAGGLLDVLPPVLGLGEEHLLELPLSHHGVQGPADPGLGQQLLHVEEPHHLAVDAVLGLATAEDRAGDLDLAHGHRDLRGAVVDHELDLGHAEGGPRGRAGEDHVGHVSAAQRPGALLAEHPADGVHEVGFPRPVRADDDGDAGLELEDGLVREGLEPADRDRAEEHRGGC